MQYQFTEPVSLVGKQLIMPVLGTRTPCASTFRGTGTIGSTTYSNHHEDLNPYHHLYDRAPAAVSRFSFDRFGSMQLRLKHSRRISSRQDVVKLQHVSML